PIISNNLRSLDLLGWEEADGAEFKTVRLTVYNASSCPISEVIFTFDLLEVTHMFWESHPIPGHGPMEPGETRTIESTFRTVPTRITIQGVLFNNGEGEGDPDRLNHALRYRAGFHEELQHGLYAVFQSLDT